MDKLSNLNYLFWEVNIVSLFLRGIYLLRFLRLKSKEMQINFCSRPTYILKKRNKENEKNEKKNEE